MGKERSAEGWGHPIIESLEARVLLDGSAEQEAIQLFDVSPALFVENQGQWPDEAVRYGFDGPGVGIAFTDDGLDFRLYRRQDAPAGAAGDPAPGHEPAEDVEAEGVSFSVSFDGAGPIVPVGLERAQTSFNYLIGDSSTWRTDVAGYAKVSYAGLYAGIDLEVSGRRDGLKYEFHVAPGADHGLIQVSYAGVEGLYLDGEGALHARTALGELIEDAPYIYQEMDGQRVEVAGAFTLVDGDTYAFEITGAYDPALELIIDPDLAWATYWGADGCSGGE